VDEVDDKSNRKFQRELNSGAVSLVLLTVMDQLNRPAYGYEIAKHLQARADEGLPMNQAAIYPVLRSLEKQRLLESETVPSDAGPPRKYYRLTPSGRHSLAQWKLAWKSTTAFVDSILENPDGPTASRTGGGSVSASAGTRDQAKGGGHT
jgi:PadR family transcriptional regulator PadR